MRIHKLTMRGPLTGAPKNPYESVTCMIYMRNLLGWLETRLAQNTLNYLTLAQNTLSNTTT